MVLVLYALPQLRYVPAQFVLSSCISHRDPVSWASETPKTCCLLLSQSPGISFPTVSLCSSGVFNNPARLPALGKPQAKLEKERKNLCLAETTSGRLHSRHPELGMSKNKDMDISPSETLHPSGEKKDAT